MEAVELGAAVADYLTACRAGGLAPGTIGAYRYGLERLVEQLGAQTAVAGVTAGQLRAWLAGLADTESVKHKGKHLSEATVEQCYRSAHTFFVWCVKNSVLAADPMAGVRKPKVNRGVPNFLSVEEMQRLVGALSSSLYAPRNLAVGMVFLDCGARRKEVADLALHDLDIAAGVLTIRRGKGGKGRRVPLSPSTIFALRCWLAVRPAALGQSLFGMTGIAIYLMLGRAAKRAGVAVSVHGLRHTFATHYDGPLDDLQKILGHASVETTITIYRHKLDTELVKRHAERSPAAQLSGLRQMKLGFPGNEG